AGARPAGSLAITAVRVEAGEPKMGVDVDERTIPQEAGLTDAAVAFDKGCFLGQELVARIDSRGRVNRHLRGIVIGESVLPPASAELVVEDKVVGTISSVAESLELRAPVALGLVRREVEPGDEVEVRWGGGSARAQVRRLPLDEFAVV
ncbi:MAG: YgfZ/GcvT domain-containing protein, partial [Acidimicrobiia bacterium]